MIKTVARIYEKKDHWQPDVARDISLDLNEKEQLLSCVYHGERQPRPFQLSQAEQAAIHGAIISIYRYIRASTKLLDKKEGCMNGAQERLEKPLVLPSKREVHFKSIDYYDINLTVRP